MRLHRRTSTSRVRVALTVLLSATLLVSSTGCATNSTPKVEPSVVAPRSTAPVMVPTSERGPLISACIAASETADPPTQLNRSVVASRSVSPEWFVYIPTTANEGDIAYLCTLSGTKQAPVVESWGISELLSDEELQVWLTSNDNEGL